MREGDYIHGESTHDWKKLKTVFISIKHVLELNTR